MRRRVVQDGVTVNAVAGTHVVFFGLDLAPDRRKSFRGFAFRREDAATGETLWLRCMKTFKETEPWPAKGEMFRSCDHPVQSFQWADYSVEAGKEYTYTVVPLHGTAKNLRQTLEVRVPIHTEETAGPTHSVFFNRGSVATQEYARRFENRKPRDVGPGAYQWLSRGLLEAILEFIGRAKSGWEIHAAVYEFQWPAVLEALKAAQHRGAAVHILYDDVEKYTTDKATGQKKPTGPWFKNREAIADAKLRGASRGRGNSSKIMHNKFFVLSRGGKPISVLTGSTNLTENGIFGHSNVAHAVEDTTVARAFRQYWDRLRGDPAVNAAYRLANTKASALPADNWVSGTVPIFSPRGTPSQLDALDHYAKIASSAQSGLFMTFAFGLHEKFKEVYRQEDDILRMALLEKEGNNHRTIDQDKKDIQKIRNRPNVVVAIGNRIPTNSFDRWLQEMDRVTSNVHVHWIHTKYMLVDPLSVSPTVVVGSANFSKASNADNDENMLIIRGDKRAADIYMGEYIRLYAHYAFREAAKWYYEKQKAGRPSDWQPQYLIDDDRWMKPYFDPKDRSGRNLRRRYFAGPMSV